MIETLLARGHRVTAFTLSNDLPDQPDAWVRVGGHAGSGFELICCPMRSRAWRGGQGWPGRIVDLYRMERESLQQAMATVKPDVVHAHWVYEFAWAALGAGLPHVITCHDAPLRIARLNSGSRPTRSIYRWLRVLMARQVLRHARSLSAVSPYMRDQIQSWARTPVQVVPNAVSPMAITLGRDRTLPDAPKLAMVCNGWEGPWKNPRAVLRAWALMLRHRPDLELHLFGADAGPGELAERWARSHGLAHRVVFRGPLRHEELIQALSTLDLLVHTSLEESFGMAIAEAMALGLPVVAGQGCGAVPWVLGDAGAGLCDVAAPASIAKAVLSVLQAERYAELSHAGRRAATQRFESEQVVSAYETLYRQAMALCSTAGLGS
ncbi:MAG: glycosyltransferase [Burkholderiaceae bacterium]|nr:glycosyltransferase [Burkholderiaceae bacterium]